MEDSADIRFTGPTTCLRTENRKLNYPTIINCLDLVKILQLKSLLKTMFVPVIKFDVVIRSDFFITDHHSYLPTISVECVIFGRDSKFGTVY